MDKDQILASKDGIAYEQVRFLFYDEGNNVYVCMRSDGKVICYDYIREIDED